MCEVFLKCKYQFKKRNTKWFESNTNSETNVRRVVSFTLEKKNLLKTLVN